MNSPSDILISVLPRHTESFLSGEKTVELRRRPINLVPKSRVWIYSKLPRGMVELLAVVDSVHQYPPRKIWNKFGHRTGLTHQEFKRYYEGVEVGCAILFSGVLALHPTLPLKRIRSTVASFLPPQFYRSLPPTSPELRLFLSAARGWRSRHVSGDVRGKRRRQMAG